MADSKLSISTYQVDQHLEKWKGGFSNSWLIRLSLNKELAVAKKLVSLDRDGLYFIKKLKHPNIITVIAVIEDQCNTYVIMEYAPGGSLRSYLDKCDPLPFDKVMKWVQDIAYAIQYLHRSGCVHRMLQSTKIFIMDDNTLKVSVVGSAKEMEQTKSTDGSGTCCWMPPEVITKQIRSPKSDVYSFGIVVWEIVTTDVPFLEWKGDYRIMSAVCDGIRPCIPSDCPEPLADLMRWCWNAEYEKRPSAEEICHLIGVEEEHKAGILSRGDMALDMYRQVLSTGKQPDNRIHLVIIGQAGVGKTSLGCTLMGEKYVERPKSTNADVPQACRIDISHLKDWKHLSQGTFEVKKECYNSNMSDVIAKKVRKQQHLQLSGSTQDLTGMIHKNSAILKEMPADIQQGVKTRLQDKGESSVDKLFVMWDISGKIQHHIIPLLLLTFCKQRTIFVVVFNLEHDLYQKVDDENTSTNWSSVESLDFFLNEIYAHTRSRTGDDDDDKVKFVNPVIMIVGTHKNSVSKDTEQRDRLIKRKYDAIRATLSHKRYWKHVMFEQFPIENNLEDAFDEETTNLRKSVSEVAENEPYTGEAIPLRWLRFEQDLAVAVQNGQYIITVEEAHQHVSALYKPREDSDVSNMLKYFHKVGVIHLTSTAVSIQDFIILSPQWLFAMFTRLVAGLDSNQRIPEDNASWERLQQQGVLEKHLVSIMWKNHLGDGDIEAKELALLSVMTKCNVLIEWTADTYIVPCKLPRRNETISNISNSDVILFIDCHGYLPVVCFHKIIVSLSNRSHQSKQGKANEPKLFYQSVVINVAPHHELTLELELPLEAKIKVVISNTMEEKPPPSPNVCIKAKKILMDVLDDLAVQYKINYNFCIECPCGTGIKHFLDLDLCLSSDENMCSQGKSVNTKQLQDWFLEEKVSHEEPKHGDPDKDVDEDEPSGSLETDCAIEEDHMRPVEVRRKNDTNTKKEGISNFNRNVTNINEESASNFIKESSTDFTKKASNKVEYTRVSPVYTSEKPPSVRRKIKKQVKESIPPPDGVRICIIDHPQTDNLLFAPEHMADDPPEGSRLRGKTNRMYTDTSSPSFCVLKHTGPICIVVWLTSEEGPHHPHPNKLVGTNCKDGIFLLDTVLENPGQPISLSDVFIVGVSRENVTKELNKRAATLKEHCPKLEVQTGKESDYDLSRVLINIIGYIPDAKFHIELMPVATGCLCDRGNIVRKEPRILQMSEIKGPPRGGQEVKLVVARLKAGEGTVMFTLNTTNPPSSWQHFAEIIESFYEKATLVITISTPSFYNKKIDSPVTVKVQVRRVDGAYSNAMAYAYLPERDDSVSITKKVNIRRPIFQGHFCCIGAVSTNYLEWDEMESKMGLPKKKKSAWNPLTPQEMAQRENLRAVIDRIPHVIPHQPLPKPKQKSSETTTRESQQRSASDAAALNDPEQLRKYKNFSKTHGYNKTVKRIEEYVENYKDTELVLDEEESLPPDNENRAQDVSDWVSSTVQAVASTSESASGHEDGSRSLERASNEDSELETIKAIAEGSTSYFQNESGAVNSSTEENNEISPASHQMSSGEARPENDSQVDDVADDTANSDTGAVCGAEAEADLEDLCADDDQNNAETIAVPKVIHEVPTVAEPNDDDNSFADDSANETESSLTEESSSPVPKPQSLHKQLLTLKAEGLAPVSSSPEPSGSGNSGEGSPTTIQPVATSSLPEVHQNVSTKEACQVPSAVSLPNISRSPIKLSTKGINLRAPKLSEGRIEVDCHATFEEVHRAGSSHHKDNLTIIDRVKNQNQQSLELKNSEEKDLMKSHNNEARKELIHNSMHLPLPAKSSKQSSQDSAIASESNVTDTLLESTGSLAPSTTKLVNHTGGYLDLKGTRVSLTIPPGAIAEGSSEDITLSLVWNEKYDNLYSGDQCNAAPVICCQPTGLKFLKPATLKVPHCAVLQNPEKSTVQVLCNEKDEDQPPEWEEVSDTDGTCPKHAVHKDHISMHLMHFSEYFDNIEGIDVKRMKIVTYVSKVDSLEAEQEVRLYLHNDHEPAEQRVEKEEARLKGVRKGAPDTYLFEKNQKPLKVKLTYHTRGWNLISESMEKIIPFRKVWHSEFIPSQFIFSNHTQLKKFNCRFHVQQEGNDACEVVEISNPVTGCATPDTIQGENSTPSVAGSVPQMMLMQQASYQYQHSHVSSTGSEPRTLNSFSSQQQHIAASMQGMPFNPQAALPLNAVNQFTYPNQLAIAQTGHYSSQSSYQSDLAPCYPHSVSFQTQSSIEDLFPYHIEMKLSHLLDPPHPLGMDWRMLASKFGISNSAISVMQNGNLHTKQVLTCIKSSNPMVRPKEIADKLREIHREDAANIIESYLDSQNLNRSSDQSFEAMNTGNSSFDSTPGSSPDKTPANVPPVMSNPHHASSHPSTYQDSLQRQTFGSPPAASTPGNVIPNYPGMTGSATAQLTPLHNTCPSGRQANLDPMAIESQSKGPTNVQPQENRNQVAELQVDGHVGTNTPNYSVQFNPDNNCNLPADISRVSELSDQIAHVSLSGSSDKS